MSLWWLSASDAELKAASTCAICGAPSADIDLGLCFQCFSAQQSAEEQVLAQEREFEQRVTDELNPQRRPE